MNRPREFSVFITDPDGERRIEECDRPLLHSWHDFLNGRGYKVAIYIDTRYKARLRLYRIYLYHTNKELYKRFIGRKSVFHGTEIGKTIPISGDWDIKK
jgi:hypothetical protein